MKNLIITSILLLFIFSCTSSKQGIRSEKTSLDPIYGVPNAQEINYNFNCGCIEYSFDKFTGITSYNSPNIEIGKIGLGSMQGVSMHFSKRITDKDTHFQLIFSGFTPDYKSGSNGVIILLENDEKIDEPDVNFKLVETTHLIDIYLGELFLTEEMIELLKNNRITDLRLFAHTSLAANDFVIPKKKGMDLKFYLNCLLSGN